MAETAATNGKVAQATPQLNELNSDGYVPLRQNVNRWGMG